MGNMRALGIVFTVSTCFAWVGWVGLLSGFIAYHVAYGGFNTDSDTDKDIALAWPILVLSFATLVTAVCAAVVLLAKRKQHLFRTLARLLLFFLTVILGCIGLEAVQAPDVLMLGGYILLAIGLFGMALPLILALSDDNAPEAAQNVQGIDGKPVMSSQEEQEPPPR